MVHNIWFCLDFHEIFEKAFATRGQDRCHNNEFKTSYYSICIFYQTINAYFMLKFISLMK